MAPVAHKFVWPQRAQKVDPSCLESSSQLTTFLKSPKSSAHASGAWRHSHSLAIWAIVTSLSDTSAPDAHARGHLRSCLYQANPCTEQKGSQPTKSLGHYITYIFVCLYISCLWITVYCAGFTLLNVFTCVIVCMCVCMSTCMCLLCVCSCVWPRVCVCCVCVHVYATGVSVCVHIWMSVLYMSVVCSSPNKILFVLFYGIWTSSVI